LISGNVGSPRKNRFIRFIGQLQKLKVRKDKLSAKQKTEKPKV
jgi:hypothetical protein